MELRETIESMLSDDPRERLQAEYDQCRIRIGKIKTLEATKGDIPIKLRQQLMVMKQYKNILESRLKEMNAI